MHEVPPQGDIQLAPRQAPRPAGPSSPTDSVATELRRVAFTTPPVQNLGLTQAAPRKALSSLRVQPPKTGLCKKTPPGSCHLSLVKQAPYHPVHVVDPDDKLLEEPARNVLRPCACFHKVLVHVAARRKLHRNAHVLPCQEYLSKSGAGVGG